MRQASTSSTAMTVSDSTRSCVLRRRTLATAFLLFCCVALPRPVRSQSCPSAYSSECPCTALRGTGFSVPCISTEDAKCYVANYLDVASGDLTAAKTHIGSTGASENRIRNCPHADADWLCYKDKYGDIGGAGDVAAAQAHFFSTGYLAKREPSCLSPRTKKYENTDRPGNAISGADLTNHAGQTEAQCLALCRANNDCFGFTLTTNNHCYIKGSPSAGATTNSVATFTYLLPDYFTVVDHGDRPNGDLATTTASNLNDCAVKCRERFDCDAFTYVTTNDNCFLKTTTGSNMAAGYTINDAQLYIRIRRTE